MRCTIASQEAGEDLSHASLGRLLESWSSELSAQAQRVRLLIGDLHWLSDGNHKEAVLRSFLRRYLPSSVEVGTGFAINPESFERVTRQQDILLTDMSVHAPYLLEESFFIVPSTSVIGTIEVKSAMSSAVLQGALESIFYSGSVLTGPNHPPWRGVVFFSTDTTDFDQFHRWVQTAVNKIPATYLNPSDAPLCIVAVGDFIAFLDISDAEVGRLRVWPAKEKSLAFAVLDLNDSIRSRRAGVHGDQLANLASAEFAETPYIYSVSLEAK